jgi:hypothetical protein
MGVTSRRLWVVCALVAACACFATQSDADPTIILSFWQGQGSVFLPLGPTKGVKTTCTGDVAHIATCDGATCTELATYNCNPFTCAKDGLECAAKCTSDAQCSEGAVCNVGRGECANTPSTCADTFAIKSNNGQLISCSPYQCRAGSCQQQCSSPSECAPGFTCTHSGSNGRFYCAKGT